MHATRPLILVAAVLMLFISACSQPKDFTTPTLAPQFGTADDDVGIDVAVSTGRIYSLSHQSGPVYETGYDGTPYQSGDYGKVFLKRQDSSGKVIWSQQIASAKCAPDGNYEGSDCGTIRAVSVVAGPQGNVSALTVSTYSGTYDCCATDYHQLTYRIWRHKASDGSTSYITIGDGDSSDSRSPAPIAFVVDGNGSTYVARKMYSGENDYIGSYVIAKYSTAGSLVWQRTSAVGVPMDITVASSGSVYVVGGKGVARYTNSGNLTWTKPGNFEQVMISGSNLFTRYRKEIRKWDGNGKQLWRKVQGGLNTLVLQDMDGDGNGNVYLSGKYQVSGPNWNAMVRKLNSSGSSLWTKTYGTPAYDDAKGVATLNGSEIYITGLTRGDLAHTNKGGEDGYVRKLNSSGNPLWTR